VRAQLGLHVAPRADLGRHEAMISQADRHRDPPASRGRAEAQSMRGAPATPSVANWSYRHRVTFAQSIA